MKQPKEIHKHKIINQVRVRPSHRRRVPSSFGLGEIARRSRGESRVWIRSSLENGILSNFSFPSWSATAKLLKCDFSGSSRKGDYTN